MRSLPRLSPATGSQVLPPSVGVEDEPVAADHPPVLRIGEADRAQPGETRPVRCSARVQTSEPGSRLARPRPAAPTAQPDAVGELARRRTADRCSFTSPPSVFSKVHVSPPSLVRGDVRLEAGRDRVLRVVRIERRRASAGRGGRRTPVPSRSVFVCSFQVSPPSARVQDLAELADDPAVLRVDELDVVEDGIGRGEALAARQIAFHLDLARAPGLSAVGGGRQDRPVADRPRVLRVDRVDVEEVGALDRAVALLERRVRLLLRPGLAAVGGVQDRRRPGRRSSRGRRRRNAPRRARCRCRSGGSSSCGRRSRVSTILPP